LRLLIIADDLQGLKPQTDSSLFGLRAAAQNSKVFWAEPSDVSWMNGGLRFRGAEVVEPGDRRTLPRLSKPKLFDSKSFDAIWVRKEPPVDEHYIRMCLLLLNQRVDQKLWMNRPESLLLYHEKNIPFQMHAEGYLSEAQIVPTCVSGFAEDWREFLAAHSTLHYIVKPWLGHGGRGVERLSSEEVEAFLQSNRERSSFLLQPYHSIVEKTGDQRILIFGGELWGSFARIPKPGSFLANLSHGASAQQTKLSTKEAKIVDVLCQWSKDKGVMFLGADLIGEVLSEVNLTCPTGLSTLEDLQPEKNETAWWSLFCKKANAFSH